MIDKELERHEIEALLPWHAAGTLSRREADLVERALATDNELARRCDLVRQELTETIHLNETLGAPSERAMEKLFAAIDAEEAGSARRSPSAHRPAIAGDEFHHSQGESIRSQLAVFLHDRHSRTADPRDVPEPDSLGG
jgi:hypothetical protein